MKLAKTGMVIVAVFYLLNLSCSHQAHRSQNQMSQSGQRGLAQDQTEAGAPIAPPLPKPTAFDEALQKLGVGVYYGNLHAHHFMSYKPSKKNADQVEHVGPGPCVVKGSMPEDDGKPCRNNAQGEDSFVGVSKTHPAGFTEANDKVETWDPSQVDRLGYFKMACEYARVNGALDVLFVTPHSKNNGQSPDGNRETDSGLEAYQARQSLLKEMNSSYGGRFFCGLGQEASSISKGNHINIFGQFQNGAKEVRPFFFESGDFKKLYSELKARRSKGEPIMLQLNHPDSHQDIYTSDISKLVGDKKAKEFLNDYGLDDYAPVGCMIKNVLQQQLPDGCTPEMVAQTKVTNELLQSTFKNIRQASANPFRLIEVVPPGDATTNATTEFRSVSRRGGSEGLDEGIYDWIFYLNMGFRLAPTANQDNHHANWGTATSSRTGILMPVNNEKEVLKAFNQRRTFASEDVNSKIVVWSEDSIRRKKSSVKLMGSELVTKAIALDVYAGFQDPDIDDGEVVGKVFYYQENENLDFNYSSDQHNVFHFAKFWVDGAATEGAESMVEEFKINSGQVVHLKLPLQPGNQYFWVQFRQKDGDRIWSAPLWVGRYLVGFGR